MPWCARDWRELGLSQSGWLIYDKKLRQCDSDPSVHRRNSGNPGAGTPTINFDCERKRPVVAWGMNGKDP